MKQMNSRGGRKARIWREWRALQSPHPVGRRKAQDNILSILMTKTDKSTTGSYISGVQQRGKAARHPGELNRKGDGLSKERWDT